jgi:spore germination protein YaaH
MKSPLKLRSVIMVAVVAIFILKSAPVGAQVSPIKTVRILERSGSTFSESFGANLPIPLTSHGGTGIPVNGRIYIFGGVNQTYDGFSNTFSDRIFIYDISSDMWMENPSRMPYAINPQGSNEAKTLSGKVAVSPGQGPYSYNGWGQHNRLIIFDPSAGIAQQDATYPYNAIWACQIIAAANGNVYSFGGWTGSGVSDIFRYDESSHTLIKVGNLAGGGRQIAAGILADNGKIYLFGGNVNGWERTVEIFDPTIENSVLSSSTIPFAVEGALYGSVRAWYFGGDIIYVADTYPGPTQIWRYHISTDSFDTAPLSFSFSSMQAYLPFVVSDKQHNKVYVIGGQGQEPIDCQTQANFTYEYDLDDCTVALWHFNEGSGGTVYDESNNHNNGTIFGSSWNSGGRFDDALQFDGENDYIMIPNATSLNPVSQITIETWIYLDHYPTDQPGHSSELILMKEQEYCLNIRRDGVPYVSICNGGTWEPALAQNPMHLHEWTHLAGTFNKTTKEIKFYVNGNLQEARPLTSWNGWNTTHNLYIGCNRDIYNEEYFAGKIDEVRISNVVRTYSEEPGYTISGKVVNSNGQAISDASVFLIKNDAYQTTNSDPNGNYEFSVNEIDGYKISASKLGLVTSTTDVLSPGIQPDIVLLFVKQSNKLIGAWTSSYVDNHYNANYEELQKSIYESTPQHKNVFTCVDQQGWELDHGGVIKRFQYYNPAFDKMAQDNQILAYPVGGGVDSAAIQEMLRDPSLKIKAIDGLCALAVINGWDGIDVDFEEFGIDYPSMKLAYSNFIHDLRVALNDKNKKLAVTVQARTENCCRLVFDYKKLSEYADEFRIMCYDLTISQTWDQSCTIPRAHAPVGTSPTSLTINQILDYAVKKCFVEPSKITIGFPTYGNIWIRNNNESFWHPPGSCSNPIDHEILYGYIETSNQVERCIDQGLIPHYVCGGACISGHPAWEADHWNIWYEDSISLYKKLDLALEYGVRGVYLFGLGSQDPGNYNSIEKYLQGKRLISKYLTVLGLCPVNLEVRLPDGSYINHNSSTVPNSEYQEIQLDSGNDPDVLINLFDDIRTRFQIIVDPKPSAQLTDSFSILILTPSKIDTLANRVAIQDIPSEGYAYSTLDTGSIHGLVECNLVGLLGVAIDLQDSAGAVVASTVSEGSGWYGFSGLLNGTYMVSVSTPLGYQASEETRMIHVKGLSHEVNFELTKLNITPTQRGMGYWKHQVNVYLSGKGTAQESLADMSRYMNLIGTHFNNNLTNPITIFQVSQPATQTDSLTAFQNLLTVNQDGTMNNRAKQQLIALMLNVVSLKLHQTTPISEDNAMVSQAITYCNQLITDSDPANDGIAKDIAENINNGIFVATGVIPLGTPNVAYKGGQDQAIQMQSVPKEFSLEQNYPNPFNPQCEISYALPTGCHVSLTIYNMLGQKVKVLLNEYQNAGKRTAYWDSKDDQGQEVTSGIYFYRIKAGEFVQSKKMVLLK